MEQRFEQILAGARSGAEWAWVELYRGLAPAVLGYLRARRAPEPEDLLGEVFLQVVRDLPRFDGGEDMFRAWVFAVAHNRLIDAVRRQQRRPRVDTRASLDEWSHGVCDSEAEALTALQEQHIHRVIGRLSQDQQSVLLLRVLGDLTVEQVARVLGKRPGAVKALQRRGFAALARELSKEGVTL